MLDPALRELLVRGYAATTARDVVALREIFTPDVEVQSRFSTVAGKVYRGHEEMQLWINDLADAWQSMVVEFEDADSAGPARALALVTLHGVGRESGVEIHEQVAHELTFRERRIARVAYVDRREAERRIRGARPTVATFDCYGTLVDWEGGLGTFLYALARRNGDREPPPGRELRERWEAIQFELITTREWRPYKDVLVDALREWCGERGYRWNANDGEALEEAMRAWQPFPDTAPALRRAREAGLRLVVVSNTDRDIISHTIRQIGVEFDDVQVAEDVRAYKPDEEVFRRALDLVGEPPEQVVHVAFGFKYDIGPAQRLGMRTAWVNRRAEPRPGDAVPNHEWRDLWPLADLASV